MFKVEVLADNSGIWSSNALTFNTEEEAKLYAQDLYMRWTAVKDWRVVEWPATTEQAELYLSQRECERLSN